MKPGQDTMSLIKSFYPGRDALVDRTLIEDPVFRELCEDYRCCFVALENLRQSSASGHTERVLEYEELLAQLSREIEGTLEGTSQAHD